MQRIVIVTLTLLVAALPALAETVTVECRGTVEYNQINSGVFGGVTSGDLVFATFTVDSEDFMDSPNYNVRGYPIDLASFQLTIGSAGPVPLVDPQPNGETSYFVIRNDDPAADGFFVANEIDWDNNLPKLDEAGNIDPYFGFRWTVGYEGDVLSSLDIVQAVGVYDYTGLTSFYTVIADAWADAMGLEFGQLEISIQSVAVQNRTLSGVKALFD
jgi:hypothetical protein